MDRIRLLSKNVYDKIAAGEVIERPASVVKELVENSIDAGARAISVAITGGGLKEIRVVDNGRGIYPEDVKLAFEKHATSKISTAVDLGFIGTQGFRGEALYSICAVSSVEMKTKRAQCPEGTHARVTGANIEFIIPAGIPDGTSVIVSDLFFNLPARRKFMKKESAEAALVSDIVSRFILAYPEISFHYTSDGKTIYHSPGDGEMRSAIYCVYGADVSDAAVYVEHEANDIKVSGFVSRPGAPLKERRGGSVFVNRRYVKSGSLHDMVRSAYGETIVKGENPFFVLDIRLPLSAVDVNVHPNKLQVRFLDAASIEYVIKEAVSGACGEVRGAIVFPAEEIKRRADISVLQAGQSEFFSGFGNTPASSALKEQKLRETQTPAAPETYERCFVARENAISPESTETAAESENAPPPAPYRLIGTLGNAYILVEQAGDLLIIDQHAAHERILYERFKSAETDVSQALLEPVVVRLSHEQKNLLDENIDAFISAGFCVEPFGALDYKISAVPVAAASADPAALLGGALCAQKDGSGAALSRESVIKAACRGAVKAGDRLNDEELRCLVESYLSEGEPPTCPHGRPVITVITKKQLEKSFKRTV